VNRVTKVWMSITNKKGQRGKPHWAKFDLDWTPELVPYIKDVSKHGSNAHTKDMSHRPWRLDT
jgi:hypothetical protein